MHALRLVATVLLLLTAAPLKGATESLPDAWASGDIGATGAAGSTTLNAGIFTLRGAGADIWNSADAFHFLYIPLAGDGSVITRVAAVHNVHAWTKAGVMMRETLAADSRHAFMLVSPGKGLAFQRRATEGGTSVHTSGGSGTAPAWLKLERAGDVFSAFRSNDGASWTLVGTHTIAMGSTIYAGVAVSSHVYGTTAAATFEWTQVSGGAFTSQGPGSLPAAYSTRDIGAVGASGAAGGNRGLFALDGAGADVWSSSDAFRFTYTPLAGDGSIVTRVVSESTEHAWVKAGVMMRESLDANARHAFMLVSPGKGLAFQRRTSTGGQSTHTSGGAGTAPHWVKLTRDGSTITAYRSLDGENWSQVGSDTIAMGSTIYVGLALSSHVYGVTSQATFEGTYVSYGSNWQPAPEPEPEPAPAPPPSFGDASSGQTLRLLHWNVRHGGIRTDGVYDPAGIAAWIAQLNPDIASLNEVDNASQMDAIVSRLNALTGRTWTTQFAGVGNLLIARVPVDVRTNCTFNASYGRVAPHMTVTINGRPINVFSAHLAVDSASQRLAEVRTLQACAGDWAEARILAGDYNMQQGSAEYNQAVVGYQDAWLAARAQGTAVNFSGNCDGCTRNSRIDYVFTSEGASMVSLKSAAVFDTRSSSGVAASDHKPLLVVYEVR